jgi:hypothetical protein
MFVFKELFHSRKKKATKPQNIIKINHNNNLLLSLFNKQK